MEQVSQPGIGDTSGHNKQMRPSFQQRESADTTSPGTINNDLNLANPADRHGSKERAQTASGISK